MAGVSSPGRRLTRLFIGLLVALALVPILPQAALAGFTDRTNYVGTTDAGRRVAYQVATWGNRRGIRTFRYHVLVTCEDESYLVSTGWSFAGGLDPRLTRPDFDFTEYWEWSRDRFAGSRDESGGTGVAYIAWPYLDEHDQPHVCSSGEVGWTATLAPTDEQKLSSPAPDINLDITETPNGRTVEVSGDAPAHLLEGLRRAAGGSDVGQPDVRQSDDVQVRWYRGKLEDRHRVDFSLQHAGDTWRIRYASFDIVAPCPSGNVFRVGYGGVFWGLPLDEHRRFDAADRSYDVNFYWSGKVRPATASGQFRAALASFVPEQGEAVETCESGPQGWSAEHSDPPRWP